MSLHWQSIALALLLPVAVLTVAAIPDPQIPHPSAGEPNDQTCKHGAYEDTLAAVGQRKDVLLLRYQAAKSDSARLAVLGHAQEEMARSVIDGIVPFWYGTPWDFNGTTEVPGSGAIACGYFVTTVLRDAGFAVERVRLAQQPSERIIRSLVGPEHIRRFSDVPIDAFLGHVEQQGHGLYVVGLDIHVGFIVHDDHGIHFVHSSYVEPLCVLREEALESRILSSSRYRVLGELTGDRELAARWLTGVQISTTLR